MIPVKSLVGAFLIVAVGCSGERPSEPLPEPPVETRDTVEETPIHSGGLTVWPKSQKIELQAEVCNAGDLVEFFAVAPYGHKYESILSVECRPSQLHTALVMAGGIDRASERSEGRLVKGSRFYCHARWTVPDRFARVVPDEANRDLKPEKLYALLLEGPHQGITAFTPNDNSEDDKLWWEVSPWRIHWNAQKGEGQILPGDKHNMPELLDPQDEEYYWRNRVRRTTVTTADKVIFWFDQPDPAKKGVFRRFGTLEGIREVPRHYEAPAGDLALSIETGEPLGNISWIFAGSLVDQAENRETGKMESFYVADRIGVAMQLMRDDYAVLDNSISLPKLDNRIGTAFTVNSAICPPKGTPVTLTFTPAPGDPREALKHENDFEHKNKSRNNPRSTP